MGEDRTVGNGRSDEEIIMKRTEALKSRVDLATPTSVRIREYSRRATIKRARGAR